MLCNRRSCWTSGESVQSIHRVNYMSSNSWKLRTNLSDAALDLEIRPEKDLRRVYTHRGGYLFVCLQRSRADWSFVFNRRSSNAKFFESARLCSGWKIDVRRRHAL